jgi:hypothetical protein
MEPAQAIEQYHDFIARGRISSHERVCEERYQGINNRLERLEKIIMWSGATTIMGMGSIIVTLLVKL